MPNNSCKVMDILDQHRLKFDHQTTIIVDLPYLISFKYVHTVEPG